MIITQEAESQDGDPDERQTEEPGLHLSSQSELATL